MSEILSCGDGGNTNAEVVAQINTNTTKSIFQADTMTDLLAVDKSIYKSVNVKGYHAENDGGGDLFNWDSTVDKSTANGGTIIDPDESLATQGDGVGNGCWVRQYTGILNVLWFGIDNTGTVDVAVALQGVVDVAIANSTSVTFEDGEYLIGSSITVQTPAKLMYECSPNVIFNTVLTGSTPAFLFKGSIATGREMFGSGIKGKPRFVATNAGSTTNRNSGSAVTCNGCVGVKLEHRAKDLTYGLHLLNDVAGDYTEQIHYDIRTTGCQVGVCHQVVSGDASFHGCGGYAYIDMISGQTALQTLGNCYLYNFDLTIDALASGTTACVAVDIGGVINKGTLNVYLENQVSGENISITTNTTGAWMNVAGSITYQGSGEVIYPSPRYFTDYLGVYTNKVIFGKDTPTTFIQADLTGTGSAQTDIVLAQLDSGWGGFYTLELSASGINFNFNEIYTYQIGISASNWVLTKIADGKSFNAAGVVVTDIKIDPNGQLLLDYTGPLDLVTKWKSRFHEQNTLFRY